MTARSLLLALGGAVLLSTIGAVQELKGADPDPEAERVIRGLRFSPVKMNLRGKDRNLVGLGSYIVNAQAGCNDCHTNPSYAEGGDPFEGEPAQVNTEGFLAGGRAFGPVISDNITPDEDGLPAGLTFAEFRTLMRTGHGPGEDEILQVMPWPVFRNMSDHDLLAIYTYLRSIPHREGG